MDHNGTPNCDNVDCTQDKRLLELQLVEARQQATLHPVLRGDFPAIDTSFLGDLTDNTEVFGELASAQHAVSKKDDEIQSLKKLIREQEETISTDHNDYTFQEWEFEEAQREQEEQHTASLEDLRHTIQRQREGLDQLREAAMQAESKAEIMESELEGLRGAALQAESKEKEMDAELQGLQEAATQAASRGREMQTDLQELRRNKTG